MILIPECLKNAKALKNFNLVFKHTFLNMVDEYEKMILFVKELSKANCIKNVVGFDFTRSIKNLADENEKLNVVIGELKKISFLKKADFSFVHTFSNVGEEVIYLMNVIQGLQ